MSGGILRHAYMDAHQILTMGVVAASAAAVKIVMFSMCCPFVF